MKSIKHVAGSACVFYLLVVHRMFSHHLEFLEERNKLPLKDHFLGELNNNDLNQVADQQFLLKQWFATDIHSCRLRK